MQSENRTETTVAPSRDERREAPSNGDSYGHGHGGQGPEHHEDAVPTDLPKIGLGAIVVIALVVAALLGGVFVIGWRPHERRLADARHDAAEAASDKPIVHVMYPKQSADDIQILLPGDVQANQSTAVFARTSGYLKPLPEGIDIGAHVKAGQTIAEIAAPEVDADLAQANAQLAQANVAVGRATKENNFNKGTFDRYEGLAKTGGVTDQQLEEKRAAYLISSSSLKAAEASVKVAEANVQRLTAQTGFQTVVAPFDGTITARNYDAGAMISATASATPGRELFRIEATDPLRVYVSVPQGAATDVKAGQAAELLVRNFAGKAFAGTVSRTAGAIDPNTRTLRVEVDVPNKEGKLFAGMYGQVRFKVKRERPAILLPTSALVFGTEGMRVVVLDPDDHARVRYRHVTVGRDFGAEAEISDGVGPLDLVVTNPGEHLTDGADVKAEAVPATRASTRAATTRATGGEGK